MSIINFFMTRKFIPSDELFLVADKCDLCGNEVETIEPDIQDHTMRIKFGYGSEFANKVFTTVVCDNCFKIAFKEMLSQESIYYA